jgi:hypothetical protein
MNIGWTRYLLASPDNLLEVILLGQPLDGGQGLAAIALLDSNVD